MALHTKHGREYVNREGCPQARSCTVQQGWWQWTTTRAPGTFLMGGTSQGAGSEHSNAKTYLVDIALVQRARNEKNDVVNHVAVPA